MKGVVMLVGRILDQVQSVVRRGLRALGAAIARVTKPITLTCPHSEYHSGAKSRVG